MIRVLKKKDWFHSDGFPIAVERRDPQEPFGLHGHEFSEIVIVTGGQGLHITGKESWPLSAGDVFVISGRRPHDYQNLNHLRLINILFDPEKLRLESMDLASLPGYHALFTLEPAWRKRHQFESKLRLSARDLGLAIGYVDELDNELTERQAGFGFLATASFMRIVGFLSRCYGQSKHPDSRALLRIAQTITHLELNVDKAINLDELARIARMSKRSFLRAFQAAAGESPIAYLIQLRVNRAATFLRQSDQSITDIAFNVGFSDSNYFTRQFRQVFGLSPTEYRQQNLRKR